jgi:hypothetical protein
LECDKKHHGKLKKGYKDVDNCIHAPYCMTLTAALCACQMVEIKHEQDREISTRTLLGHITRFMITNPDEIKKREAAAIAAIKKAFGTADDESGATLFVSHHLEEIDSAYWKQHFSTETPDPHRILDSLVLQSHWGGDDEIDTFDFTLPEDVTNYLISVSFDDAGEVSDITMES